jgi:histidine ammonia-lyase
VLEHVERIVAIELLCGTEALDRRLDLLAAEAAAASEAAASEATASEAAARVPATAPVPGAGVAAARDRIRAVVSPLDGDREPGPDLAALTGLVHDGALVDLVTSAGPTLGGGSAVLHSPER